MKRGGFLHSQSVLDIEGVSLVEHNLQSTASQSTQIKMHLLFLIRLMNR